MKLNKFFLLGLASLAFAACSSDEDVADIQSGEKQSVVLKINTGDHGSRALGDSQTELGGQESNPNDGSAIQLNKVTIFYAKDGSVVRSVSLSSSDTEKWNKLTGDGYVENNLPSSVNKVFVAGNMKDDLSKVATQAELEAKVVQASTQTNVTNIVLYGVGSELKEAAHPSDQTGHQVMKKTTVNVKPLISRIEISGIQCEDLGNQYSTIDLKAIGLMNVWQSVTLGSVTEKQPQLTLDNVAEPGQNNGDTKKAFEFGAQVNQQNFWAWDAISNATLSQSTSVYPTNNQEVYGYNFIAVNEEDLQVKLYMEAKKGTTTNPVNNTITAKFPNEKFAPGYIYKVQLKFKESNIGPWDPSQTQCIQVNVTVQKWEVKTLTPSYE